MTSEIPASREIAFPLETLRLPMSIYLCSKFFLHAALAVFIWRAFANMNRRIRHNRSEAIFVFVHMPLKRLKMGIPCMEPVLIQN